MTEFTPLVSALGGMMIGLAAVLLMAFNGRIAGISGILGGLLPPSPAPDRAWRVAFLAGMVAAPLTYSAFAGSMPEIQVPIGTPLLVVGGLIVGSGLAYSSGCTSGHGVCGIARLSPRSIVATLTFMATTAVTVFVVRHVFGA